MILLDSDCFEPIEGEQTDWLQGALAEGGDFPYRFAVYHMAAYPSHYSFNGAIPKKIRAHWCPLFDQYQLHAAFEDHNHTFKKTFPLRNNQIDEQGTIYFGDGCWGALPRVTKTHWYLAKQGRENHVYLIDLDTKSAKIKAIDLQGKVIDYTEIPADK